MSILSEKAMLSVLKISAWTARKIDKKVTNEVLAQHGATHDAGHFSKRLVAKGALDTLQGIAGVARTYHYEMTMPWLDNGPRLLPAKLHREYEKRMETLQQEYTDETAIFIRHFPDFKDAARRAHNGLFCETDYPSQDKLEKLFGFSVSIYGVPDERDFRVDLGSEAVNRIRRDIEARNNDALNIAKQDVFTRVFNTVSAMVEKLTAYKPPVGNEKASGIFRDTLVSNVTDLASLLPGLNVAGDTRIDALVAGLNRLTRFVPDALREDKEARVLIASEAQAIITTVSDYL